LHTFILYPKIHSIVIMDTELKLKFMLVKTCIVNKALITYAAGVGTLDQ